MSKPVCRKCGSEHWRFIPCAEVELENEREAVKTAEYEAARVVPVVRNRPARDQVTVVSRNFVQQAPGVYRRRRAA